MMRLTKMVTDLNYWEENMLGDDKIGLIPVWYRHEIRVAKPMFNPMSLQVIGKEFVEKYGEGLGVYVNVDKSGILWWSGFCLFKNNDLFPDFEDEYPNLRIKHFDETWMEIFSSFEGKERWELKSLTDVISSLKIDLVNKLILINNQQINGIQFEENQTILNEAKKLIMGGESSMTIDSEQKSIDINNQDINGIEMTEAGTVIKESTSLLLGENATEPLVLGNALSQWLSSLVDALAVQTHVSGTPGSPTSPPVNAAAFTSLKSQIPSLVSLIIKGV